jgi:DNA-binding transcriptional regulator PaaX
MDFKNKYPLSTREIVYTPMILRDGLDDLLPYPSLNGIRDFAEYCGISDSAVRTSLSRGCKEGAVRSFKDNGRITRFQMVESQIEMGKTVSDRLNQPEGFIIAVFSFRKDEEAERIKVREVLKYYGFKKLAQNTYINGRIETQGLKKAMKEFGLEKKLYLFHCPNVDDEELIEKILSVFEIEKRNKFLQDFYNDMIDFISEKNLDIEEIIHRIYYLGPVHWTICFVDEPPFPLKHLPEDYPLFAIIEFYKDLLVKYNANFVEHFIKVNI